MEIRWIKGQGPGFENAEAIRRVVFCAEQGYKEDNEFDATDEVAWHLVGTVEGTPACTARLYADGDDMRFGRVAVLKAFRGLGLGAGMLDAMVEKAAGLGAWAIVLDA